MYTIFKSGHVPRAARRCICEKRRREKAIEGGAMVHSMGGVGRGPVARGLWQTGRWGRGPRGGQDKEIKSTPYYALPGQKLSPGSAGVGPAPGWPPGRRRRPPPAGLSRCLLDGVDPRCGAPHAAHTAARRWLPARPKASSHCPGGGPAGHGPAAGRRERNCTPDGQTALSVSVY
jgi:hypothetical protein